MTNYGDPPTPQAFPEARAYRLLMDDLTLTQLDDFIRIRSFPVVGSAGGAYRINSEGAVFSSSSSFCVYPESHWCLPVSDRALLMKWFIEANESRFLQIANTSLSTRDRLTGPRHFLLWTTKGRFLLCVWGGIVVFQAIFQTYRLFS